MKRIQKYQDLTEFDARLPREKGSVFFCSSLREWAAIINLNSGSIHDRDKKVVIVKGSPIMETPSK